MIQMHTYIFADNMLSAAEESSLIDSEYWTVSAVYLGNGEFHVSADYDGKDSDVNIDWIEYTLHINEKKELVITCEGLHPGKDAVVVFQKHVRNITRDDITEFCSDFLNAMLM